MSTPGFIPAHGGYRELVAYQKAEVVYDITFRFCQRFLSRGDRTIDQMVQAARSCKQNMAEGSQASGTSKEAEINLTGVARASLEELLNDYRDFLRVRDLPLWDKDSRETMFVQALGRTVHADASRATYESYETYRAFVETRSADVVANIAICLIHQTNYLPGARSPRPRATAVGRTSARVARSPGCAPSPRSHEVVRPRAPGVTTGTRPPRAIRSTHEHTERP